MAKSESGRLERFCRAYLRTMDPERAAREAGCRDGFAQLAAERTQRRLEQMREAAVGQLRREDALRRLSAAAEAFAAAQLERGFKTLDFYKSLQPVENPPK